MDITVSDVLATRVRAGDPPRGLSVFLSILFHGSFLVVLLLISKPKKLAFVPNNMPVRIVSGGSIGRPQAAPAAPAVKPKPAIERPNVEEPVSPTQMKLPQKAVKEKPRPVLVAAKAESKAPAPVTPPKETGPQIDTPTVGNGGGGGAVGAASFGTSVSAFDVDFPYSYYAEQLVSLIGANWLKPNTPDGTACVVSFRVLRSGQVTDVKVDTTSGFPFFDRAASRAVYQSNPLPPLPPEFKSDSLGVRIKFL